MSVEDLSPIENQTLTNDTAPVDGAEVAFDENQALEQSYDKSHGIETEQPVASNADERDRDGNGRFVGGQKDPVEGEEGESPDAVQPSTLTGKEASLPTILRGLAQEDLDALPEGVRATIAEREAEWNRKQSDLGRRASESESISHTVDKYKNQFEGLTHPDTNQPVTREQAVDYLFNAQRAMNQDPLNTLVQFADEFGVRDQLMQVLGGQNGEATPEGTNQSALLRELASLRGQVSQLSDPSSIDGRFNELFEQRSSSEKVEADISRFSADKPLYSKIPQDTLVHTITVAKAELGGDATNEQVLELAYDMSVNMIPSLRAEAAAATPNVVAIDKGQRVRDQRQANAVNVKSTSTGKAREPTEDESLAMVYDKAQQKG